MSKSVLLFLLRNSEKKLTLVFPSSIALICVKIASSSYSTCQHCYLCVYLTQSHLIIILGQLIPNGFQEILRSTFDQIKSELIRQ
jgi:hypothetical protein